MEARPSTVGEQGVFRSLFGAYPDALLLVDAQGRIALANPMAHRLLGYDEGELIGRRVEDLVPEAVRARHVAYRHAYAQAPRARPMGTQMELAAMKRDGSQVMVEIALSPLQEHGLPYVVAAVRDISAYPRVRQALQRARYAEHVALFGRLAVDMRSPQELMARMPSLVTEALQIDACGIYLPAAHGGAPRRVGAHGWPEAGALEGHEALPARVLAEGRAVSTADPDSAQRFALPSAWCRDGWASALGVPVTDRGRSVGALVALARGTERFGADERRFLEALAHLLATALQRAQTEEQLQHAQRLESVGQLTGGIAHDFNNLLTVIAGNLQILDELPALGREPASAEMLHAAMRATRRAAELTGKLLAFSRRQVLQPERIDPALLLSSLTDMLRRTLDQRIAIELMVEDGCPACTADAGQLEAALLNVAINARDAMPQGGRLRFAAASCPALPPELAQEWPGPRTRRYVAIVIADSGCGMPEEVREHAFEPFFTTKEAGRGTGLGLSTVYGFAKQSQGAVTLDSAPDAGTTVTLYLPRHEDAGEQRSDEAAPADDRFDGLRVLAVEDEAEVRQVLLRFLEALHCEVTVARSAEEALQLLDPDDPVDLLLCDIALGAGLRGTELARRATDLVPGLAVLLISGFPQAAPDTADRWELLRKPFRREELARAMARALRREA